MATVIDVTPVGHTVPTRHRFDVDDLDRLYEHGFIPDHVRTELIDGEIIEMAAAGHAHWVCVNRLTKMLVIGVGDDGIVGVQNPLRLHDFTRVEPDLYVLRHRDDFWAAGLPNPRVDVLLAVEVSDTTARHDLRRKAPIYAKAGVTELWVVDINQRQIVVHLGPDAERWESITDSIPGDTIAPLHFPALELSVAEILGTPPATG